VAAVVVVVPAATAVVVVPAATAVVVVVVVLEVRSQVNPNEENYVKIARHLQASSVLFLPLYLENSLTSSPFHEYQVFAVFSSCSSGKMFSPLDALQLLMFFFDISVAGILNK
jgi:hypothetical protein